MRIVSLLPSATEMICGIGLRDQLVAVTHECDFPPDVVRLPKVTETRIPSDATSIEIDRLVREQADTEPALYRLDPRMLAEAAPDLIVSQTLCDVCAVAPSEVDRVVCGLPNAPSTLVLEPTCLADLFSSLLALGDACGAPSQAQRFVESLECRVDVIRERTRAVTSRPKVLLLEWIDPPFTAGHWNPELVELAGGCAVLGEPGKRSVTTSWDVVADSDPDLIVIACCGFEVARTLEEIRVLRRETRWQALRCVRAGDVFVVDGSAYFNRPGPRLIDSLEVLAHIVHPSVHPATEASGTVVRLKPS